MNENKNSFFMRALDIPKRKFYGTKGKIADFRALPTEEKLKRTKNFRKNRTMDGQKILGYGRSGL